MKLVQPLILLTLSILFITSCGKDEDESIVGTWKLKELDASACMVDDFPNPTFESTADGLCFEEDGQKLCVDLCLTFNENGTVTLMSTFDVEAGGIMFSESDTETGTWTENGSQIEICDEDNECVMVNRSSSGSINFSDFDEDLDCQVNWTLEKA